MKKVLGFAAIAIVTCGGRIGDLVDRRVRHKTRSRRRRNRQAPASVAAGSVWRHPTTRSSCVGLVISLLRGVPFAAGGSCCPEVTRSELRCWANLRHGPLSRSGRSQILGKRFKPLYRAHPNTVYICVCEYILGATSRGVPLIRDGGSPESCMLRCEPLPPWEEPSMIKSVESAVLLAQASFAVCCSSLRDAAERPSRRGQLRRSKSQQSKGGAASQVQRTRLPVVMP